MVFIPLFGLELVFSEQLENVYEVCVEGREERE